MHVPWVAIWTLKKSMPVTKAHPTAPLQVKSKFVYCQRFTLSAAERLSARLRSVCVCYNQVGAAIRPAAMPTQQMIMISAGALQSACADLRLLARAFPAHTKQLQFGRSAECMQRTVWQAFHTVLRHWSVCSSHIN